MNYLNQIQSLKNAERESNPEAKYLVSKVFSEFCVGAVGRSRIYSFATKQQALDYAIELIGDYDLSTSEWYEEKPDNSTVCHFGEGEIEMQAYDRAESAMLAELDKYHRIRLGDFNIEIDELEA